MRICDHCREPKRPVVQFRLGLEPETPRARRAEPKSDQKVDPKDPKADLRADAPDRGVAVDLCAACVGTVMAAVVAAYDLKCNMPPRAAADPPGA